jgi:hypothetical protein
VLKRDHAGLRFATVRDGSGDLQLMISQDVVGRTTHALWQ